MSKRGMFMEPIYVADYYSEDKCKCGGNIGFAIHIRGLYIPLCHNCLANLGICIINALR